MVWKETVSLKLSEVWYKYDVSWNGWYKNDEEMKRNTFFRMAVGRKPKASRILVRIEWIVDDKLS